MTFVQRMAMGFNLDRQLVAIVAAGLLTAAGTATAQLSITNLGAPPAAQNFDGMGTDTAAAFPPGFQVNGGAAPNWDAAGFITATTRAAGTTGSGALNGTSGGGAYNFADGVTASSTDRALGFLNSGSFSSPRSILVQVQNNTGATVDSLSLAWDYEKYRSGSRAWTWTFSGSPDGSNWTPLNSGDLAFPADANNTVVFNPPTATGKSATVSGLGLANGGQYYFRWTLTGSGGSSNGQGLAIDNLAITASAGAVPVITADVTSFTSTFGNGRVGTPTASSAFTITGSDLTTSILVEAPAGFEISNDDSTWTDALNYGPPPSVSGTVFVRFNPVAVGATSSAAIALTSGAASPVNVGVSGFGVNAPISIAGTLPVALATETFDSLPNTGSAAWENTINILGWYANRSIGAPVTGISAGTGSSNAGGLYSFGVDLDNDRALGSIGSGTPGDFAWGVNLKNNTASVIDQLRVQYTGEQWRASNAAAQAATFGYLVSATPITEFTADLGGYIPVPALDFTSPQTGASPEGGIDGNDPANSQVFDVTITGLAMNPGDEIMLKWFDINHSGNDHGLSIDNVTITALGAGASIMTDFPSLALPNARVSTAGAPVSVNVSGSLLTDDITVTAPAGVQVSLDDVTYGPSVIITESGGSASSIVFVRFNSATPGPIAGSMSGDSLTATSSGAAPQSVTLTGNVFAAPISIGAVNVPVSENFDSLPDAGTADFVSSVSPVAGWYAARANGGPLFTTVAAGTGTSNAGNLYSFGLDSDRALGDVGAASTGAVAIGAIFKNNTGVTITDLQINYTGEQWRDAAAATNTVEFYYGVSSTPITTFDATFAAFTFEPNLIFTTPQTAIANAINGNDPANRIAVSYTIGGLNIAPGGEIVLKWLDLDNAGSDHGIGIDDFSLVANPGSGPSFANGDANADTFVDVADVTTIFNFLAGITGPVPGDGDYDNDTDVDADDATALINFLVNTP